MIAREVEGHACCGRRYEIRLEKHHQCILQIYGMPKVETIYFIYHMHL